MSEFPVITEFTGNFHRSGTAGRISEAKAVWVSVPCGSFPCEQEQGIFFAQQGIRWCEQGTIEEDQGCSVAPLEWLSDAAAEQAFLCVPAQWQGGPDQSFQREIGRLGSGDDRRLEPWRQARERDDACDVAGRDALCLCEPGERGSGPEGSGPAMRIAQPAQQGGIGSGSGIAGHDFHLDAAPLAGEGRLQAEKRLGQVCGGKVGGL